MAEQKFWFARRFPLSDPRNSMSPVSPEGFRVAWTFMWLMVAGAAAWALLAGLAVWSIYASGIGPLAWVLGVLGPIVFIGCAIYGTWYFIMHAKNRGDQQHTLEDYKAGRVK